AIAFAAIQFLAAGFSNLLSDNLGHVCYQPALRRRDLSWHFVTQPQHGRVGVLHHVGGAIARAQARWHVFARALPKGLVVATKQLRDAVREVLANLAYDLGNALALTGWIGLFLGGHGRCSWCVGDTDLLSTAL